MSIVLRENLQPVPDSPARVPPSAKILLHVLRDLCDEPSDRGIRFENPEDGNALTLHHSWAELYEKSRQRACWLSTRHGIHKGDRVLLSIANGFPFVQNFFALWFIGAIPVPVPTPSFLERQDMAVRRVEKIASDAGACAIIASSEWTDAYTVLAARVPSIDAIISATAPMDDASPEPMIFTEPSPEDIALLQYTSGSTTAPRGVVLTHANLRENTFAMGRAWTIHEEDKIVGWLPLYHDLGLIGQLLTCVCLGMPLVMLSVETFLKDPLSWLRAISEHDGTISHAPNFALARCTKRAKRAGLPDDIDLSKWRDCILGGEFVEVDVIAAFCEAFAPVSFDSRAISPAYGLAEHCVGVTHRRFDDPMIFDRISRARLEEGIAEPVGADDPDAVTIANVGSVVDTTTYRVVDEQGNLCGEREVGELWLAGPSVTPGYWRNQEATEKIFTTALTDDDGAPERWLRTGDLVYTVEDRLLICGRVKELMIIHGRNYFPTDFERAAEAVDGVRKGGTVAFAHREAGMTADGVVMVCEVEDPQDESLQHKIEAAVAEAVGVHPYKVQLAPHYMIPKTSSGKRQRLLAKKLWLKLRS